MEKKERPPVYYSEYLQLDKILEAQDPESAKEGIRADDEMLFIIIHQTYELWFKQILHELNIVRGIFKQPNVSDNSADIFNANSRLKRIIKILEILVAQISVLETMTPLDFLDFRDMLRPASGFQSIQFKILEARLGLGFNQRHGQNYYLSQLKPEDVEIIRNMESKPTLLQLLNRWLERIPFFNAEFEWKDYPASNDGKHPFWKAYEEIYVNSLGDNEKTNAAVFRNVFFGEGENAERSLSPAASRAALFIMLYRRKHFEKQPHWF